MFVPAIISAGQELGSTGRQMLDAYVAGYEIWANLVSRERDSHHMKGWHSTGIFVRSRPPQRAPCSAV